MSITKVKLASTELNVYNQIRLYIVNIAWQYLICKSSYKNFLKVFFCLTQFWGVYLGKESLFFNVH